MPWETEGDGIRFSGLLTDLMTAVMTAYDEDKAAGTVSVDPGAYVTATAVVLREIVIEALAEQTDAAEFVDKISDSLEEDEDGTIAIQTFSILDDIAEHIEPVAWHQWIADPGARAAIAEVSSNAFQ